MDKREDDILNDVPDGEENGLPEMPETLRGDSEPDKDKENESAPDLSDFLDENTEVDDISIDPELDRALSKFADDTEKSSETGVAEPEQTTQKKTKSSKLIGLISVICVVAVLVIGGGLFAFFQLGKSSGNYIMSFDKKNIDIEEFKFFLLCSDTGTEDVKQTALDGLIDFLIFDKALKDYGIVINEALTADYIEYVKSSMDEYKNYFAEASMPKISDERLESIFSISIVTEARYALLDILMEKIAEEQNYTVDEAAVASELETYSSSDKLLKYILTETREQAEQAYNALVSGSMSAEEAMAQYSINYEMYGVEQLNLSDIGLTEEDSSKVMTLNESEYSEIINLGVYVVFIAATDEEIEDWYRSTYQGEEADFESEFANYIATARPFKYIVTETRTQIEEAYNILSAGSMSVDEVISLYSFDYEQYGIQLIDLSNTGVTEEETVKIAALQETEYSDIIEIGSKLILITATDKETEDWVRDICSYNQKSELLNEKFINWESEANIQVKDKIYDEFDADAYFASVAVG